MTKFCKDCRHCVVESGSQLTFARCAVSVDTDRVEREYLVTGERINPPLEFCSAFRICDTDCGFIGRLWEAKE